jgi:hypothetical protein
MRWQYALAFVGVAACGVQSEYTQLNTPPRAMMAKAVDAVQVFSGTTPTRPFVEVGLVTSRAESTVANDLNEIIRTLRERAATEGCDGLVNVRPNNRAVSGPYGGGTLAGYEATCIVFKDGPAASPAPTPAPAPPANPTPAPQSS